ncbi:MAG: hypothetical protein JRI70_02380 [Deltaproteobacteria bacterium]|nr:hypothetical protein [Deltaproteobacteria bacterium]MBW2172366.1 hypothetical protein [Deltaproteobacteria bacterium]
MKSGSFILLIVIAITLGFNGIPLAGSTITQVTNNSYEDSFPRIKGDYLVWQGYVDGDQEIFLYNIATGETTQITYNDYDDLSPQTDGSNIVWHGFKDGEWDIFLWDGSTVQTISDRSAEDVSPQIANGLIVWASAPFGGDSAGSGEIMFYDVGTKTHILLSGSVDPGNVLDDSAPRISAEEVMWTQTDNDENTTMYLYSLPSGPAFRAPESYIWKGSAQSDGNLMVSTPFDGNDKEIVVHDNTLRSRERITNNDLQDTFPSISGNYVAWVGGQLQAAEIYLAFYEPTDSSAGFGTGDSGNTARGFGTGDSGDTGTGFDTGDSGGDSGLCFVSTVASSLSW